MRIHRHVGPWQAVIVRERLVMSNISHTGRQYRTFTLVLTLRIHCIKTTKYDRTVFTNDKDKL